MAIPELSAYEPLTERSPEWSPEAYIDGADQDDEALFDELQQLVNDHAAFYVRYGHRLIAEQPAPSAHVLFGPREAMSIARQDRVVFRVADHFTVDLGGRDEIEDLEEGNWPFVSTSESMNGVKAWKLPRRVYRPLAITVATDGSTCSSFVQEFPFYAFYKVAILRPRNDIPDDALYFVAYLLQRERWRYVYARKFGKSEDIRYPVNWPGPLRETRLWHHGGSRSSLSVVFYSQGL